MLDQAFVETSEYQSLTQSFDFHFVVGRRGTGKSALYKKVQTYFGQKPHTYIVAQVPEEHVIMALQAKLADHVTDYRGARAICRLAWKLHIYLLVLPELLQHYKLDSLGSSAGFLRAYAKKNRALIQQADASRCLTTINAAAAVGTGTDLLQALTTIYDLKRLGQTIQEALAELKYEAVVMFDGLDEGWMPAQIPTAILGGLAMAVADLVESSSGIHGTLLIRDNVFRALAFFDQDFSRHIEGAALRLHWDAHSLLHLVAQRLRVALGLQSVESDAKVWNRFAQRGISDIDGFKRCLLNTLYRPRDVLVLLNQTYQLAKSEARGAITDVDVEVTARRLSENRLDDLHKEYEVVFPGLRHFAAVFRAGPARMSVGDAVRILQNRHDVTDYSEDWERDFAILGSGQQIFFALYSVGFIGLYDGQTDAYTFCHDGAPTDLDALPPDQLCLIHPCYWRALDIAAFDGAEETVVRINDEYEVRVTAEVKDQRMSRLGEILGELDHIPEGLEGSSQFEKWTLRTLPILFAGRLANFERHPNADAISRRDIISSNRAEEGVWLRIRQDYGSRQVVFETKNYAELKHEDMRQMIDYLTGEYGKFGVIVTRSPNEYPNSTEKGWLQAAYHEHELFIVIMPAVMLARGVRKLRNPRRGEYMEEAVQKHLDYYVRSVLSLTHQRSFRQKTRKARTTGEPSST